MISVEDFCLFPMITPELENCWVLESGRASEADLPSLVLIFSSLLDML